MKIASAAQPIIARAMVYLALAAMMLRALTPAGWMPAAPGQSGVPITICTMHGPMRMAMDADHSPLPVKQQDNGRKHDICPFAAAPHYAISPPVVAQTAPHDSAEHAPKFAEENEPALSARHSPQSSRGPPLA